MRKVAVTGLGVINSVGHNVDEVFENLCNGVCGIDKITHFDASDQKVKIAAEVKGFNPLDVLDAKEIKKTDRFIHLGLKASAEALADANITDDMRESMGVSSASGMGGLPSIESNITSLNAKNRVSPFFIPSSLTNMLAGYISIKHSLKGPNLSSTTACTAGLHAINVACKTIMINQTDSMLVVGSEAVICKSAISGFATMKALSTKNDTPHLASSPFDSSRDGFVMGEGAGAIVLEELESAKKRGAKIYATIEGFGESADASHITTPSTDGPIRAIKQALKMASNPKIDYINAHGTSTPLGDINETKAFKSVFDTPPPISSIKGSTGHALGATGTIEAVVSIKALEKQIAPPTINLNHQDNECDLDYIANTKREMNISYALSTNYGFGGTNGAIIFQKYFQ